MQADRIFSDMLGRQILLPQTPRRIISTVPSQTELLYDLGLSEEVIGITKFCVHPENWFAEKTKIGGTKNLQLDKIRSLQPDLIIANKEENSKDDIEVLAAEFPVWISDVRSLKQNEIMIAEVGRLVDRSDAASKINDAITAHFQSLELEATIGSATYFIWRKPWMVAGSDTFIDELMRLAGFQNAFADTARYPEIDMELLRKTNPDFVFLSSEPYPFKDKHIAELQAVLPDALILLVDGELFSWYGSRMQHAAPYLQDLRRQVKAFHKK